MAHITSIPYYILSMDSQYIPVYICAYFTIEQFLLFLYRQWIEDQNNSHSKYTEEQRKHGLVLGITCIILLYCLCSMDFGVIAWILILPTLAVYMVQYIIEMGYSADILKYIS